MRNTNLFSICCAAMLVASISFGNTSEMSGRDFAHKIIVEDSLSEGIPQSAVDDFLSSINDIEKSRFVRVSFTQMSNWRKKKFEEAAQQWARGFPAENYRVDVIIKAHASQTLVQIAQLFIVAPLPLEDNQRLIARQQLEEIQTMIDSAIAAKLDDAMKQLRGKYPFLGEDFSPGTNEDVVRSFISDEEDDLNPFQCYPLGTRVFEDTRESIGKILESISIPVTLDETMSRWMEEAEKQGIEEKIHAIVDSIKMRVCFQTQSYLNRNFFSKISVIFGNSFSKAVPQSVLNNYQSYAKEISTLVDSEIIKEAFEVQSKIGQEETQKWVDDHRKEFEMLVASQPKDPAHEVYEIPKPSISVAKITVLVVSNVGLIVILIILYLRHRRSM